MTSKEAISHIEFSIKAYQNLIDNDTRSGEAIGNDIKGEWKSESTLADAYMTMIESLRMAVKALELVGNPKESKSITVKQLEEMYEKYEKLLWKEHEDVRGDDMIEVGYAEQFLQELLMELGCWDEEEQ